MILIGLFLLLALLLLLLWISLFLHFLWIICRNRLCLLARRLRFSRRQWAGRWYYW